MIMNVLNILKYLLMTSSIIYIFINWKVAIMLFIIASIVHSIPLGPYALLGIITGYFFIAGVVFIFLSWKVGIMLILFAFLTIKFRAWSIEVNRRYYQNK